MSTISVERYVCANTEMHSEVKEWHVEQLLKRVEKVYFKFKRFQLIQDPQTVHLVWLTVFLYICFPIRYGRQTIIRELNSLMLCSY